MNRRRSTVQNTHSDSQRRFFRRRNELDKLWRRQIRSQNQLFFHFMTQTVQTRLGQRNFLSYLEK